MPLSLSSRPVHAPQVSHSSLGDEVLIIDTTTRKSHRLLETASFIWHRCDGKQSAADIANALVSEYDVTQDIAERDVLKLLEDFAQVGVIQSS